MAWIESHQEIGRHPKTRKAARLLNCSVPQMVGHLHLLWHWALDFAPDGDVTSYDAPDLADAAMWEGDPQCFVNALVAAGFLESTADRPALIIHDWYDYAGKLIERRKADAARKRSEHTPPATPPPSSGVPADFQRSSNGVPSEPVESPSVTPTVPYPNPNQESTIPPTPQEAAASAEPETGGVDNFTPWFDTFWDVYPARRGKKLNKTKARDKARHLSSRDWDSVLQATRNYAESDQGRRGVVEDAHRFLSHWRDWQEPETEPTLNGAYSHERSRYESPAERKEREWAESFSYRTASADPGWDSTEPPALPSGTDDPRVIEFDRRRVGGDASGDPDHLAYARLRRGVAGASRHLSASSE